MPLYGRDYEIDLLQSCLAESKTSQSKQPQQQLVLIQGESGIGKTSLVEECFRRNKDCLYATGKCEELRQCIPLLALTEALEGVCDTIQQRFTTAQLSALKQELSHLTAHSKIVLRFKSIRKLLNFQLARPPPMKRHESRSISDASSSSFAQFQHELRDFLRAVTRRHPLVLFLDDIQWACKSTLALLRHLSTSSTSIPATTEDIENTNGNHHHHAAPPNLLLVVAMRDGYDIAPQLLDVPTTFLALSSVSHKALTQLVLRLLRDDKADGADIADLVELVRVRTGGNPYFATQFLHQLLDQQLVYYDALMMAWMYNVAAIRAATSVSDNIVDYLLRKIKHSTSPCAQQLLTVAAFVGSKFPTRVAETVVLRLAACSNTDSTVTDCHHSTFYSQEQVTLALQELQQEGMLVEATSSNCKFAHDRIQQASYQLIPENARQSFHLTIGRILMQHMPTHTTMDGHPEDNEQHQVWSLLCTEQLNHGVALLTDAAEKVAVAKLNLTSAHHASLKSSHSCAAQFCQTGLALLGTTHCWELQYQLTKDLSILLAEMEFCLGHHEACRGLIQILLTQLKTFDERLPVYIIQMEVLSSEGSLEQAMQVGRSVLSQLGHGLPAHISKRHVFWELVSTKRLLRGVTDDDIRALPELTDSGCLTALQIMSLLGCYAYSADQHMLMLLLPLVEMKLLLTRGVSPYAGDALASYGVLIGHSIGNNNNTRAFRFSQLSLEVMERYEDQTHDSQTLLVNHFFLRHLKKPVHDSIDPLFSSYQLGMDAGDIHNASLAFLSYICCYASCGLPLAPVVQDTRAFRQQLTDQSQDLVLRISDIVCQSMLNLMGGPTENDDPLVLTGEAMNEERMLETNDSSFIHHMVYSQKAMLALYFGNFSVASDMARKLGTSKQLSSCNFMAGPTSFLQAMAALGSLHSNTQTSWGQRRRRLKRVAHQHMRKLERWVKQGNPNVQHMLLILQAEEAHVDHCNQSNKKKKNADKVKALYDKAIAVSLRSGFTHNAALCNERCAVFLLDQGDADWALYYLERALELFLEWGAMGKARHMEQTYPCLAESSSSLKHTRRRSTHVKGVSRFGDSSDDNKRLSTSSATTATAELLHHMSSQERIIVAE